jgi:hypothetical protein
MSNRAACLHWLSSMKPSLDVSRSSQTLRQMIPLVRLAISAAAGAGAAIIAALIVTVIELYVAGHGHGSITREVISWAPAGVHLSIGDIGVLLTAIAVAVSTWHLVGRGG